MPDPLTWTFQPDWSNGVIERIGWLSALLKSITGTEQAISTRYAPRRSLEANFLLSGRERSYAALILQRLGSEQFRVPLWFHRARLTAAAASGATVLACDTVDLEFRNGDYALLVGPDAFGGETVQIAAVAPAALTLVAPLGADWPQGSVLHPLRTAWLTPGSMQQPTENAMEGSIRFEVDAGEDVDGGAETYPIYDGLPVLALDTNWAEQLDLSHGWIRDEHDSQTGLRVVADTAGRAFRTMRHGLMLCGRSQQAEFRALLRRLRGRQGAVWIPSHGRDVEVLATALSGTSEIEIARIGLAEVGGVSPDIAHLLLRDGTAFEWNALALPADPANERLQLAAALPRDVVAGETARFMQVARLDQDDITIRHETDSMGVATCNLSWTAFDQSRSGLAAGDYPIPVTAMNSTPCAPCDPKPAWLGTADAGIDFVAQEAYFDCVHYTNLADVCGGGFTPAALSAEGYDTFLPEPGGSNIRALSPMLAKFAELDWSCVIEWKAKSEVTDGHKTLLLLNGPLTPQGFEITRWDRQFPAFRFWVIDFSGDYDFPQAPAQDHIFDSLNKLAVSSNAAGWISSLNGGGAWTEPPMSSFLVAEAHLGGGDSGGFLWNGFLRSYLFYPATDAAGVQALST